MATTGFWPVKGSLKDVIDYAENPDKTTDAKYLDDDLHRAQSYVSNDAKTGRKMYVSTVNCPKYDPYGAMMATKRQFGKLGGNVAFHGFQSFKPGEVTPEEAQAIGMETAKRMWGEESSICIFITFSIIEYVNRNLIKIGDRSRGAASNYVGINCLGLVVIVNGVHYPLIQLRRCLIG